MIVPYDISREKFTEEILIYSLLLRTDDFLKETNGKLPEESWFLFDIHRNIVKATQEQLLTGEEISTWKILDSLETDSMKWFMNLAERVNILPKLNIKSIMKQLNEKHAKRCLRHFALDTSNKESVVDSTEKLNELISRFHTEMPSRCESVSSAFSTLLFDILNKVETRVFPMPWGILSNMMSGGLREGEMMIVAARPGVGKSALGLNIAIHLARQGVRTLFASLEMPVSSLAERLISSRCEIPLTKIRKRTLSHSHIQKITRESQNKLPLLLTDKCFTISELEHEIIANQIDVVLIDYLQLLGSDGKSENRQNEVSKISRTIKQIALRRNIGTIVLSQLNREIERRKDRTPVLSDLRESGQLEQDADQVMFLHRPGMQEDENNDTETELIIAKHRQGPLGKVFLDWRPEICSFL